MDKEQVFFLRVLADSINNKILDKNEQLNIDLKKVIKIAHAHKMIDVLYLYLVKYLEAHDEFSELYLRLRKYKINSIRSASNRVWKLKEIEKKLTEINVPFFVIKGAEISKYYPSETMRFSVDVDFVAKTEYMEDVEKVMLCEGFSVNKQENHEWVYKGKFGTFEVHDRLLFDATYNKKNHIQFCDTCWDYVSENTGSSRKTLDLSFHFIYLLLHLRKHMIYQGVGFKQFLDLAVLVKYASDDLDYKWMQKKLVELDLFDFASICLSFCEKWFNVKSPFKSIDIDSIYESATEKIFSNGVFGYNDESNKISHVSNSIDSTEGSYNKKTFVYIIRSIFPSYKDMKTVKEYEKLDNKPILLPIFWIYRWFRVIFIKKDKINDKLLAPVKYKEDIENRNEELLWWGL